MKPTADELLQRYADAAAQDTSRPSAQVREAIRAHASMLAQARTATPTEPPVAPSPNAANQSRWAVSLLASLAVVGLSTLLMLQIDRGSPEDREVAMVAPKPAHTAPERPTATTTASVTTADAAAPPPPAAARAPKPAPAPAPARERAEAAPPRAGNAPEPDLARARESVAPPTVLETHTKAQPLGTAQGVLADNAPAPAAPPPPYAPPAAAPRADSVANMTQHKATAQPHSERSITAPAPAAQARAQLHQSTPPATQFIDAVHNGQIAIAEALVRQGQSVNTRDDRGNTALMLAVRSRQTGMAAKLLALGADNRLVNHEGLTALDLARQLELHDMVQLLQTPK